MKLPILPQTSIQIIKFLVDIMNLFGLQITLIKNSQRLFYFIHDFPGKVTKQKETFPFLWCTKKGPCCR